MEQLIKKYCAKIEARGLAHPGGYTLGAADDTIFWNRESGETAFLEKILNSLNISSLLFAEPAEPYLSIMNAVSLRAEGGVLTPEDSETRTFLHEIPVIPSLESGAVISALKKRKGIIIPGRGIITHGIVTPEQAFVNFSSILFSLWVKFFTDYAAAPDPALKITARSAAESYIRQTGSYTGRPQIKGPFENTQQIFAAICETGRHTVESGMVDSFFGNISYSSKGTVYISRTSAPLDELEGEIDACPSDGSSTAAVTASSELTAHRSIYERESCRALLHGHPRFSVIMSMLCHEKDCPDRGLCHRACPEQRNIAGIPVVPGEVGTGRYGICRTLPPAMSGRGAIVWGHGLFTRGEQDFREAFESLMDIERSCFELYIAEADL